MPQRICLVTPYSWSQAHDANEHIKGVSQALRARGHDVVILAPSARARDLQAGRRALQQGTLSGVVTIAPALPVSPRSSLPVPVGVRANVASALQIGQFDVVHGIDPGVPGLSYVALVEAHTTTAASFLDAERLSFPPRKNLRDRLLARIDTLIAPTNAIAEAVAKRFPGEYTTVPLGVGEPDYLAKRKLILVETSAPSLPAVRAAIRSLRELPDWEAIVVRTSKLAARPPIPSALRSRVHIRTAETSAARAPLLAEAAIVVPAQEGSARLPLEAVAAGCALVTPPGLSDQPELAGAAILRLAENEAARATEAARARKTIDCATFQDVAEQLEGLYLSAAARRRPRAKRETEPLADRDWILADLHMHTSWSGDCSTDVAALIDHAEEEGLGAIAITDHNVFGGALEGAKLARNRDLIVIPGEEIKTDNQGEVIGLFLSEEIPRGLTFAETVAAIREQDGLVYVPHPFDRMHAIPSPATLHRHLPEIDVLEVYNARLLFDAYNDEALRFARKYGLLAGAGSDAHVLQGVGTGALRLRRFDGPEEFLLALRTAEVVRRPKSLALLQSLKWVAQVKEKVR